MNGFYNTGAEVVVAGLISAFSTQLFKFVRYNWGTPGVDFKWLVQTGGMPSSHSAAMCSMAASVGLIEGFESVVFAVALGMAMVVMYDAAGLRRAAGRMASILNKMTEDFYAHHPETLPERLRELLGHTPTQVIIGAFWGIAVSYLFHQRLLHG